VGWEGGGLRGELMGVMYNVNLIRIVTMNPFLANEYTTIKNLKKKKFSDEGWLKKKLL
jgi:hypothetical protein